MSHINLNAFVEKRNRIKNAFRAARNLDEMLRVFADAEEVYSDRELGEALLNLSMRHYEESADHEKTLSFALRGLKTFVDRDDSVENAVPIAIVTQISGLSCLRLKRYDDSLYYLNTVCRLLNKLRGDSSIDGSGRVLSILHDAEFGLFNVKKAVGTSEDAVIHLTNAMELGEIVRKDNRKPLYSGYRQVATEYVGIKNYVAALYHCLKGLEILMMEPGRNPSEVLDCRRNLGLIFRELNGEEKALDGSVMLRVQAAIGQIELGRYDEAIDTLTATIPRGGEESEQRATVIASMSKTLASMGKTLWRENMFADAKRCLDISLRIIDKQESYRSPHLVVASLLETSEVFEEMKETETAIMGSYYQTIKLLEKVVEYLKGHGPSAQENLDKAIEFLEQFKEKARNESSESPRR